MPESERTPPPTPGRARIVVEFQGDGNPAIQVTGGITPSQLCTAAKWLDALGTLQINHRLLAQLQADAPRVVVPAVPVRPS